MRCTEACGVGYQGQRYEVRYDDADSGDDRVFGWTNDATGGSLLEAARLWPKARNPRVVDLQPGRLAAE